jgi:hypothetical protein
MAKAKNSKNIEVRAIPPKRRKAQKKKKRESFVITSHKARSEWFRDNVAWPQRDAPTLELVHERARIRRTMPPHALASDWEMAGPTNIGGRMTAVVVHPQDQDTLWAGAAGGGVWHSTDAGITWQALWHQQESLNVGALAMDPNDPMVLYCGTGEANLSADSYPGIGLFRTQDGGATWDLIQRTSENRYSCAYKQHCG